MYTKKEPSLSERVLLSDGDKYVKNDYMVFIFLGELIGASAYDAPWKMDKE